MAADESTPLLRRLSIPPVFTQPRCFEQMSDKTSLEGDYQTPACKLLIIYISLLFSLPVYVPSNFSRPPRRESQFLILLSQVLSLSPE
jgi:hypothetical protein